VAAAALAGGEVELQVGVVAAGVDDGGHGGFRQHGAAQVGVHHHARGVQHAAKARAHEAAREAGDARGQGVPGERRFVGHKSGLYLLAQSVQEGLGCLAHQGARDVGEVGHVRAGFQMGKDPVHGRQEPEQVVHAGYPSKKMPKASPQQGGRQSEEELERTGKRVALEVRMDVPGWE